MQLRTCCAALLILSVQTVDAGPPTLVKEHGDISRLIVQGNETFSQSQFLWALDTHLDLLPLMRPGTPYSQFAETLKRLITGGYLKAGFADVRVEVNYDEERDRTVVTIVEGPRYRCGGIEVDGVEKELARLIERRLTQPFVQFDQVVVGVQDTSNDDFRLGFDENGDRVVPEPPRWALGEPVDFHSAARPDVERRALQTLAEAGFFGSEVAVSIQTPENSSEASLTVAVRKVGIPIVLKEIVIQGAQRNSADDVLHLLEVQAPARYTPELRRDLTGRLWDCGRFRRFGLHVESAGDLFIKESAPSVLRIELAEYDGAPLLTEELNDVDQILCKAARWLTSRAGRTHDLMATWERHDSAGVQRIEFALSRNGDIVANLELRLQHDATPVKYTLVLENGRFTVLSGTTHRRFACDLDRSVRANIALVGQSEVDSDGRHVSMNFGMGLDQEADAGICLGLAAAPMAMLYQARLEDSVCTLNDGILTTGSDGLVARFAAETGRWIGIEIGDEQSGEGFAEVGFEEQGFERATEQWTGGADDNPPVNSLSAFIAGELSAIVPQAGFENGESIITLAAFTSALTERLDQNTRSREETGDRKESLHIPLIGGRRDRPIAPDEIRLYLQINSLLFPRDSTYWTIGRELLLALAVQDEDSRRIVQRLLQSHASGPLMYWYAAEAFRHFNPVGAQVIAREGLNRLDRNRLVEDCRPLLNGEGMISMVLENCLGVLRAMSDEQLDALLTPIVGIEHRVAMIDALRRDGSSNVDVLLSLLGELWDAKLHDIVRARLETLCGGPEIRNAYREPVPDAAIRTTALAP